MQRSARQRRDPGRLGCFFLAYAIFGLVGSLTSLGAWMAAVCLPRSGVWSRRVGQGLIHRLFRFFVWFIRVSGLLRLESAGLASAARQSPLIYAGNHPSLLDAVLIAAHVPRLVCLMKPGIRRNPVLGGHSRLAGYVHNLSGPGLIKSCHARLKEGSSVLIFPEGTRTVARLGRFKMGFALLSRASGIPVQAVVFEFGEPFLGKTWPFFKPPRFPLECKVCFGERFFPENYANARDLGEAVERWFRLSVPGPLAGAESPCTPATLEIKHGWS